MGQAFSNQSRTQGSTTSQQTEAPNITNFRNSLYPQISQYLSQAQQPVYGQAQYGQQLNNLNGLANSSINQLSNTFASRMGGLNAGAYAGGVGNILNNRAGQLANYNAQVPLLNRQAQMQQTIGGLQLANSVAGPALRGSQGTSDSTTSTTPSIFSDVMQGVGAISGVGGFLQPFLGGGVQNPSGGFGQLPQGEGYGPNNGGGGYGPYGMQPTPSTGAWPSFGGQMPTYSGYPTTQQFNPYN